MQPVYSMIETAGNACDWVEYQRGGANALLSYVGGEERWKHKLLRLRLASQSIDTIAVYEYVESEIRPKLAEVVGMELVKVEFQVQGCLNEGYGLVLDNLVAPNSVLVKATNYLKLFRNDNCYTLELKPKWLHNFEPRNCRNCAHYWMKHGKRREFCSLDLLYDCAKAVQAISHDPGVQKALLAYFSSPDNILVRLQRLQHSKPILSVSSEADVDKELITSMTLKDLTVFFSISGQTVQKVTVTDTDPKSVSKWQHWLTTESQLHAQGYYANSTH